MNIFYIFLVNQAIGNPLFGNLRPTPYYCFNEVYCYDFNTKEAFKEVVPLGFEMRKRGIAADDAFVSFTKLQNSAYTVGPTLSGYENILRIIT